MDEQPFLIRTLGEVADALSRESVPHALAGGLAFSALVEPRATVDIDFLVLAQPDRKPHILSALGLCFDALLPHAEPMRFERASIWRVVGIKGNRELLLDFLLGEDPFHREALTRSTRLSFHGHELHLVTLEDLYILKARAGRPQDRLDIETIERLKGPQLDRSYLRRWIGP